LTSKVAAAPIDPNSISEFRRWSVTLSGLLGAVSMILSATVVNVAVPSIMGAYGIDQTIAQWASTVFITTMVASQLMSVWVVAHLGQRNAYAMTLVLFVAGGFVCTVAPNMDTLIVGRVMQGISAGVVQPLVLSTIISVFPLERRGFAVSMYSVGVTLAPSFGPVVGGAIGRRRHPGRPDLAAHLHRAPAARLHRLSAGPQLHAPGAEERPQATL